MIDDRGRRRLRYAPFLPNGTLGTPVPIFHTEDEPSVMTFDASPDGALLAHTIDSTGPQDIFLTQFPSGTGRWQVSRGASPNTPRFSHDGRELFYFNGSQLMAVPITSNPLARVGQAAPLFDMNALERTGLSARAGFDVSSDGRRFLMSRLASPNENGGRRLILIQNWLATLKK